MNSPITAASTRLVLVGGGPRAIGVLERLGANARSSAQAAALHSAPLHVDIVDPHMPGAGRIWRADESPLLLMNSRAADVSIFTDETVHCEGPIEAGPSLAEWAEGIRRGQIAAPTAGTARLAEIEALQATDFASRRVQALYLEWFFGQVLASLPQAVTVTVHRTTATAVHPVGHPAPGAGSSGSAGHPAQGSGSVGLEGHPAQGAGSSGSAPYIAESGTEADDPACLAGDGARAGDGAGFRAGRGWVVELEDRAPLRADLLLLAAGHTDSRPSATRHELAAFARRHGGAYLPPSQAGDAALDLLAPDQDVIVRGMGLAFVDLMALLTEGRGGSFTPDVLPGEPGRLRYHPSGQEPRLWVGSRRGVPYHSKVRDEGAPAGLGDLVHVTAANLAAREDAEGHLDFRTDVVPLIAAEIHRWVPDAPSAAPGEGPLGWLDDPLSWLHGDAHPQVTRDAVVRHIEHDLRARTHGEAASARALFQLLLRLHGVLVDQLPASRLRGGAEGGYPRWWHSLFSFVDSGPPPHRLHQLLALERAGVAHFLGPRLVVTADESSGRFTARGAAGVQVSADALVDAFLPTATLAHSTNPLLRSLVEGSSAVGRESESSPGTLEVDQRHRVIGPDGAAQSNLWALGPWTSEMPLGAFARPGTDAPCHRRNDALARELLAAAQRHGAVSAPASAEVVAPATVAVLAERRSRSPRLGVFGPGKIGSALARTALRSGLEVHVAGRAPASALAAQLPGAMPVGLAELAASCDVLAITVPLHVALALDPDTLRDVTVIDATNPWGEADAAAVVAARAALGDVGANLSTSELLAARLPHAQVVKTLNHIGYHDVEDHGREDGHPHRRAIAVAADDPRSADAVSALLQRLGYDPVAVGTLADGRDLEPGAALFGTWSTAEELSRRLQEQIPAL